MANLTSTYPAGHSVTNIPEGPAQPDISTYLQSLIQREDEWKRRQYQQGLTQPTPLMARAPVQTPPQREYHEGGSTNPEMRVSPHADALAGMEPYYVAYGTGFNDLGGARLTAPGPNAVFGGYRPKGSIPQSAQGVNLDARPASLGPPIIPPAWSRG